MEVTSPAKNKKMKKDKLSNTVAGKEVTKETILNRMSTGKKRPKSEPRTRKGQKTPLKADLLAKKLFQDKGNEGGEADIAGGELGSSPVKTKKSANNSNLSTPGRKKPAEKTASSTSKWQVSQGHASVRKPENTSSVKKDVTKGKGSKREKARVSEDDAQGNSGNGDEEIDFPQIKRKSLGLTGQVSGEKAEARARQVVKETSHGGSESEQDVEKAEGKGQQSAQVQKGKKRKSREVSKEKKRTRKRGGKKRKRSSSRSQEPQAKKGKKAVEGIAVRCGNLPLGAGKTALKMFFGEADISFKKICIKTKLKSLPGEKKRQIRYATMMVETPEEVDKMCALNGIGMPSPLGSREGKLLIHKVTPEGDTENIKKRKLFLSDLHYKATEADILKFFEEQKLHPTNVIIPRKRALNPRMSRRYAFVWLESVGDVNRALGLKQPSLLDRVFTLAQSKASQQV